MAQTEFKVCGLEFKSGEGDGSTFEGYGAIYNNIDGWGDIIAPGAFAEAASKYLANGSIRNAHSRPVGLPTAAEEKALGLWIAGRISDTAEGRDCKTLLRDRVIKGLSVGYVTQVRQWLDGYDEVKAYWDSKGYVPSAEDLEAIPRFGSIRLITKAKLYEVSLTDMPANERAQITSVKSGPHGGRTLTDQFSLTLGSVEDLAARFRAYCEKKSADGRPIPPNRRAQIATLRDQLSTLLAGIETEAKSSPATCNDDQALMDRFAEMNFHLSQAGL